MPIPTTPCRRSAGLALLVLGCLLAGCNDFAQRRLGGLRPESTEQGPPKPAPALSIASPPHASAVPSREEIKPSAFVPGRDLPELPQLAHPNVPPGNPPNPLPFQHPLRVLYERAAQRHASMDSYIFRLRRREVAGGRPQPEELIRIQVRLEPYSVALKWLGEENKGREVIYVRGKYDNKMQVHLPASDPLSLLMGRRLAISPDDSLARSRSRYPITTTGFGASIERYGRLVAAIEKGDPREGTAKYLGRVTRPEFSEPVESVHQVLAVATDPLLPRGGQRWWFFDATSGLPVLIVTHDASDTEVEYYCHDLIQCPVRLDDDDFNPDRLWRK